MIQLQILQSFFCTLYFLQQNLDNVLSINETRKISTFAFLPLFCKGLKPFSLVFNCSNWGDFRSPFFSGPLFDRWQKCASTKWRMQVLCTYITSLKECLNHFQETICFLMESSFWLFCTVHVLTVFIFILHFHSFF